MASFEPGDALAVEGLSKLSRSTPELLKVANLLAGAPIGAAFCPGLTDSPDIERHLQ